MDLKVLPSALAPEPALDLACHEFKGRAGGHDRLALAAVQTLHDLVRATLLAGDVAQSVGEFTMPKAAAWIPGEASPASSAPVTMDSGANNRDVEVTFAHGLPQLPGISLPAIDHNVRNAAAQSARALATDLREIANAFRKSSGSPAAGAGSTAGAGGMMRTETSWRNARLRVALRSALAFTDAPDPWDALFSCPGAGQQRALTDDQPGASPPPPTAEPAVLQALATENGVQTLLELMMNAPYSLQAAVHTLLRRVLPTVPVLTASRACLAAVNHAIPLATRMLTQACMPPGQGAVHGGGAPPECLQTLLRAIAAIGALPASDCPTADMRHPIVGVMPKHQIALRIQTKQLGCFSSVPVGPFAGTWAHHLSSLAMETLRSLMQGTHGPHADDWANSTMDCVRSGILGDPTAPSEGWEAAKAANSWKGAVNALVGMEGRGSDALGLRGTSYELAVLAEAAASAWTFGGGRSALAPGQSYRRAVPGSGGTQDESDQIMSQDLHAVLFAERREGAVLAWDPGAASTVCMEMPEREGGGETEFGSRVNTQGRCNLPGADAWDTECAWASGPFAAASSRSADAGTVGAACVAPSGHVLPFAQLRQGHSVGYASTMPPTTLDGGLSQRLGSLRAIPTHELRSISAVSPFCDAAVPPSRGGTFYGLYKTLVKAHNSTDWRR